jgi:uracil-DNA glycosylase
MLHDSMAGAWASAEASERAWQTGRLLAYLAADQILTSPVKYLPQRGTPVLEDIVHGRTHLMQQIDIIDPRLVVLMGRVAARAVLGMDDPITKEHGHIIERDGGSGRACRQSWQAWDCCHDCWQPPGCGECRRDSRT